MTVIELVWKDTIVWKGLNAKSNMFVVCRTHTPQYELFGTESLWKCLLPSAELHACNNLWSRCSYDNSFLSWLNSSPIRWQFMVYELITCYSQSRDPFKLCNTDNWIDWSSACTCHMKYSRQRWKWPPKSAHPMMWLYNCHPGCFFVFRRKWFIDCSCILQCFFMLVWIDTIVWSGLDAKSSMSVGCCTHTMLFYVNRLGLTLWKCLLPLAELDTCLNMQIEFTHLLHSVPPPHTHCILSVSTTHTAHFQFQLHTHTSQCSTCSISLFTAKALAQGAFSWSTHCSFSNMLSIL